MIFRSRMFILIVFFVCLVLLAFLVYSPPRLFIRYISNFYPDVLFHVDLPSSLPYLALTIDDFPNSQNLSVSFQLLDLLRQYDAKCTFFTIGSNVDRYGDSGELKTLFERIETDGHELGNHGWRDEQAIRLSPEALEEQILHTQTIMSNASPSRATKWFRPGSGFFNRTMINLCTRLGYRLVLGSIYPYDPQIPYSTLNSFYIQSKLYPGAIIILHDRQATIATLERVLPAITQRAFRLVTLTELIEMKSHQ